MFALAGLLFATSFQAARGTDLRSDRGLPGLIDGATRDVAAKSAAITTLQTELDALTAAAVPSTTGLAPITDVINLLAPVVGTRAVQGPAVTVALTDSSATRPTCRHRCDPMTSSSTSRTSKRSSTRCGGAGPRR